MMTASALVGVRWCIGNLHRAEVVWWWRLSLAHALNMWSNVELLPSLHRRAPALYMYKLPLGTGIIVHVPVHDVHVLGNRPSFSFSKSI